MKKAKLRRGFKTEADKYAREFRGELGLPPAAPLCPWKLASHLEIPVVPLSALGGGVADDVAHLQNGGQSDFFAATVFYGTKRVIVSNDVHHELRQASDIAHELAHGILGHPPTPPLTEFGCRNFDAELEAEANWLGPALLISREAALAIARNGLSVEEASLRFRASKPVVRMRLNVTGAKRIVARARRKWGR